MLLVRQLEDPQVRLADFHERKIMMTILVADILASYGVLLI